MGFAVAASVCCAAAAVCGHPDTEPSAEGDCCDPWIAAANRAPQAPSPAGAGATACWLQHAAQRASPAPSARPAVQIAAGACGSAGAVPASLPCQRAQAARWTVAVPTLPLRCCRMQQCYWTQPAVLGALEGPWPCVAAPWGPGPQRCGINEPQVACKCDRFMLWPQASTGAHWDGLCSQQKSEAARDDLST